jgi:acetyl esterase
MKGSHLKELAPAVIATADVDMLRDDRETYARKLRENCVSVRLKKYINVPHPFMFMEAALCRTSKRLYQRFI